MEDHTLLYEEMIENKWTEIMENFNNKTQSECQHNLTQHMGCDKILVPSEGQMNCDVLIWASFDI